MRAEKFFMWKSLICVCIALRDENDLLMKVQHAYIALRGAKDLPLKVKCVNIVLRGDKDLLVEIQDSCISL